MRLIPTYELLDEGRAIRCLICLRTSWHPMDVRHKYCGFCHQFHDVLSMMRALEEEERAREERQATDTKPPPPNGR